jgi:hypothetical protein
MMGPAKQFAFCMKYLFEIKKYVVLLSGNSFKEVASSDFSVLKKQGVFKGETSLMGNVEFPSVTELCEQGIECSQDDS